MHLTSRLPGNDEELLHWLDLANWEGQDPRRVWHRMVGELTEHGWYQFALKRLAQSPRTCTEMRRIREEWAEVGLLPPWLERVDLDHGPAEPVRRRPN